MASERSARLLCSAAWPARRPPAPARRRACMLVCGTRLLPILSLPLECSQGTLLRLAAAMPSPADLCDPASSCRLLLSALSSASANHTDITTCEIANRVSSRDAITRQQ